jgi:hypothetical protein
MRLLKKIRLKRRHHGELGRQQQRKTGGVNDSHRGIKRIIAGTGAVGSGYIAYRSLAFMVPSI